MNRFLLAVALLLFAAELRGDAQATGTLIVNARIVDGSGRPASLGSVCILGDRIHSAGSPRAGCRGATIDAGGLFLAPGFIDTHSHHDRGLAEEPEALAAISQGITTIIVGQDGSSRWPLQALFAELEGRPAAVNVASFVGHNTIRGIVLGQDSARPATAAERDRMRALLRQGMRAGALGLSTGLEYEPGYHADTGELIDLAREAARHGGRYSTHMRSEDRDLWQALEETLQIGREARIPVHVSHMKLAMVDWWGQAPRYLGMLDRARASGIEVTGDVYPYTFWQSTLTVLFPDRDFTSRESAEMVLRKIAPAEGLLLARYTPDPSLAGSTLAEIAERRGQDPAVTLMDLIARSQAPGEDESVIGTSMREDDVSALIAWPHANICSDGSLHGRHPRGSGAFTRVLREQVRERGLLSLESAVAKMTSAAAAHAGIVDRGVVRPGAYADLVLFDPDTVADRASTAEPDARSAGIHTVWVNGVVVYEGSAATGAHPGRVVRRGPGAT